MSQSLLLLLADLESALAAGDPLRHVRALSQITGIFVASADRLAADHAGVYDAVLERLIDAVDLDLRVGVANALAPIEHAPHRTMLRLARDELAVAEPVLRQSPVLTQGDLADLAQEMGQGHLLAIAGRSSLDPEVTDVLVRRGDQAVLCSTAGNAGARFSQTGFGTLVERADGDAALQQVVGLRPDLPPAQFKLLIERAGDQVRDLLVRRASPRSIAALSTVIANLHAELDGVTLQRQRHYAAAADAVARLGQSGKLNEPTLAILARSGRFNEVVCALSALTRLSIDAVETALSSERRDGAILMARSLELGWPTACQIFGVQPRGAPEPADLAGLRAEFDGLSPTVARRALGFMTARPQTPLAA